MLSRLGVGSISRLNGQPWPFAQVKFSLTANVLSDCNLAYPQNLTLKANSDGLIEVPLLVGGTYRMALSDGQTHEFTVATGTGSFCLWDAVVVPPTEDFPWFVRSDGDTMEGDLDFNGNAIANAQIDSSNTVQFLVLSGVRPGDLELGQTAYDPSNALIWVGTGESESYGADGSQIIPSPSQGKGWREFSLVGGGDDVGGTSELPLTQISGSQQLVPNQEYWLTSSALSLLSLPATATARQRLIVRSFNSATWRIVQDTGQQIQIGDRLTTEGPVGRIESLEPNSFIELIYTGSIWVASEIHGNFEVI